MRLPRARRAAGRASAAAATRASDYASYKLDHDAWAGFLDQGLQYVIITDKNVAELVDSLVYIGSNCNHSEYPTQFQTYQEAWESINRSLDYLRATIGQASYKQLLEMAAQAKAHYDRAYAAGFDGLGAKTDDIPGFADVKLGSWLLQDMERVVAHQPPFAYPEDMYRWPR